jgi:hypothetical protein
MSAEWQSVVPGPVADLRVAHPPGFLGFIQAAQNARLFSK